MKPENLRHWTIHIKNQSDVPVSRNWYKTVSNLYENSYIYAILYKSCSIKQIIFNKYATNVKTIKSHCHVIQTEFTCNHAVCNVHCHLLKWRLYVIILSIFSTWNYLLKLRWIPLRDCRLNFKWHSIYRVTCNNHKFIPSRMDEIYMFLTLKIVYFQLWFFL